MKWITNRSIIRCGHDGTVITLASQHWVRVGGASVLVAHDPQARPIAACPNVGPTIKPCTVTLRVAQGYSNLIRIDGNAVVLSNLDGLTDGTVPGTVHYQVRNARQNLVRSSS
jgi:hypothetical protein